MDSFWELVQVVAVDQTQPLTALRLVRRNTALRLAMRGCEVSRQAWSSVSMQPNLPVKLVFRQYVFCAIYRHLWNYVA